ncbi:MAG: hypothetical protein ACXU9U_05680 [Parachlamydiaceae bacterium]
MYYSHLFSSFFCLCFFSALQAASFAKLDIPWHDVTTYESTTARFLQEHPFSEIDATLRKQSIILKQKSFFDIVTEQEEPGHIGYNASSHHFRIFQDIIRIILEEIVDLEFKKDFHFFRLPHDENISDFNHSSEFLTKYHPSINDNLSEQRDQLISVNFTPYGNFTDKYECTAVFFEKSLTYRPPSFHFSIENLFDRLGIPFDSIPRLFEAGEQIKHPHGGVLFQFFDLSYQNPMTQLPYAFVDQFAYPCLKKGVWLYNLTDPFSDLFQGFSKTHFEHQYRLIVNHSAFLNPYSSLYIRRYELNDPKTIQSYENRLRSIIRSLPFDPIKVQLYKNKLLAYWKK